MTVSARYSSLPTQMPNGRDEKSTRVASRSRMVGAESLRLLAELLHQLRTLDALGEAGVVLDVGGDHQLPHRHVARDHERLEVGPSGVDGGGEAGRPGADDRDLAAGGIGTFVAHVVGRSRTRGDGGGHLGISLPPGRRAGVAPRCGFRARHRRWPPPRSRCSPKMAIGMRRLLTLGARTDAAELLDSGRLSRSEVEANLADLARLNRLPGGTDASVRAIEQLIGTGNDVRILDVGTGAGDMPIAFAASWLAGRRDGHQPRRPGRRGRGTRGRGRSRARRGRRPRACRSTTARSTSPTARCSSTTSPRRPPCWPCARCAVSPAVAWS